MSKLETLLKLAEESVRAVEDPELRKIAFQEILRHNLRSEEVPSGSAPRRPSAPPRQTKKRASPGARAGGPLAVRPEVETLDLSPDEPGLVPWNSLSTDWRKFCWVLEAARQKKIDGLTNAEISYVIDKVFRQSYEPKVVNNLKVQIKNGMVKPATAKSGDREYAVWRILAAGIKEVTAKAAVAANERQG